MNETKPPPGPDTVENATRFKCKEQASQYAKQNGHDRYMPYKLGDGKYVLKSLFHPSCFIG